MSDLRTPCARSAREIVALLRAGRFDLSTEYATQADIDRMLATELGPQGYRREARLSPKERPDFLVGEGVVIEVKHRIARPAAILDQLERYAGFAQVTDLILATGRTMALPATIGGKPAFLINLGQGWL